MQMKLEEENITEQFIVNANVINPLETNSVYVTFTLTPNAKIVLFSAQCFLQYTVEEINQATKAVTSSYEDEYQIDDLEICASDYFLGKKYISENFDTDWEAMKAKLEKNGSFQLQYKTVELAIKGIINNFSIKLFEIKIYYFRFISMQKFR